MSLCQQFLWPLPKMYLVVRLSFRHTLLYYNSQIFPFRKPVRLSSNRSMCGNCESQAYIPNKRKIYRKDMCVRPRLLPKKIGLENRWRKVKNVLKAHFRFLWVLVFTAQLYLHSDLSLSIFFYKNFLLYVVLFCTTFFDFDQPFHFL